MAATLPSGFGTQLLYSNYYKTLPNTYDDSDVWTEYPGTQTSRDWESNCALYLVQRSAATKIYAADNGAWSTAANWYPNGVPGAGDKVVIGEGVSVTYDANDTTNLIQSIRVDGNLVFKDNANTGLYYDTIVIPRTGYFCVGNTSVTISLNVVANLRVNSTGAVDITADPSFVGRGILNMGRMDVCGTAKTPFVKLINQNNPAGVTQLLIENPTYWAVGDEIIIGGDDRQKQGWNGFAPTPTFPKDDFVTITAISISANTQITFTPATQFRHSGYRSDHRCYVGNLTRNVNFYATGVSSTYSHRAHIMFMHDNRVNVRYARVKNMGRTVKGINTYYGGTHVAYYPAVNAGTTVQANGSFASGGVATLPQADKLFLGLGTSGGTVTITGTDPFGNTITDTVNTGAVPTPSTRIFKTVTQFTFNGVSQTQFWCDVQSRAFLIVPDPNGVGANGVNSKVWDKWLDTNSATQEPNEYLAVTNTFNARARYPLHFHFSGKTLDRTMKNPPNLVGCVVQGEGGSNRNSSPNPVPGWGIVVHQSYAVVKDCIVYDVFGAGLVSEDGNEMGSWDSNMVCRVRGNQYALKGVEDNGYGDVGRQGAGIWNSSRNMKTYGNVVHDCDFGISWNMRNTPGRPTGYQFQPKTIIWGKSDNGDDIVPIPLTKNNVVIATDAEGFAVEKLSHWQGHDQRTVLEDITMWSTAGLKMIEYTSHYTLKRFDIHPGWFLNSRSDNIYYAMGFGLNSFDQVVSSCTFDSYSSAFSAAVGINATTSNLGRDGGGGLSNYLPGYYRILIDNTYPGTQTPVINWRPDVGDQSLTAGQLSACLTVSVAFYNYNTPTVNDGYNIDGSFWCWGNKQDSIGNVIPKLFFQPTVDTHATADEVLIGWPDIENYLVDRGYFTNGGKKYLMFDLWYSDRASGTLYKKILPACLRTEIGYTTAGKVNNGATTFGATGPTLADFAVTLTMNSSVVVDVVGRATHSGGKTMYFGGSDMGRIRGTVVNEYGTGRRGFTYIPPPDFTGSEVLRVWVDDADFNTTVAQATLVVQAAPTFATPVANPDFVTSISYGATVTYNVLANDLGGQVLTLNPGPTVVGGNAIGTATVSANQIVFVASTTFAASNTTTAQITYSMTTTGGSATGQLFITINPPPPVIVASVSLAAPIVGDVSGGPCFGGEIVIANALSNSSDPNQSPLPLTVMDAVVIEGPLWNKDPSASGSVNGRVSTLAFQNTGNILFYAPTNYSGNVKIRFSVANEAIRNAGPGQWDPVFGYLYIQVRPQAPARAGSGPSVIGAPVSWTRQGLAQVKQVAKRVSSILADADILDHVDIAKSLINRYTFAEIQKILATDDFEMLLNLELEARIAEMERNK